MGFEERCGLNWCLNPPRKMATHTIRINPQDMEQNLKTWNNNSKSICM
jgi:hypothetical protein